MSSIEGRREKGREKQREKREGSGERRRENQREREREREGGKESGKETFILFHRTMVGRGRAWLRFVLMQKKMADHFKMMTDNKRALR